MKKDQMRWDLKYRERKFDPVQEASTILKRYLRFLPRGKVLDLAAGEGRNAVFLAEHGFDVEAMDISKVAMSRARKLAREKGVRIKAIVADLDTYAIPKERYELVIDFYFLDRGLIPRIKMCLKKGGMVVFETYTAEQKKLGTRGPGQDRYVLKPNELLRLFRGFHVLFYREGVFKEGGKRRAIASLIAQKQVIGQR